MSCPSNLLIINTLYPLTLISWRVFKPLKMKYKVRFYQNSYYEVLEVHTKYGERISAYESEPDTHTEESVFKGSLADCEAYIRLHENGYM